jgi:hypothetical protein
VREVPPGKREAFLCNDAAAGMRGDVDRLREVEAAILGVNVVQDNEPS